MDKDSIPAVDKQAVQRLVIRRLAERRVQASRGTAVQAKQPENSTPMRGVKGGKIWPK